MTNNEIFANNLRRLMNANNKTRNDVCKALDVKYTTFCDWYNGNKYPRIHHLEMLANYFGVSKSELIEEKKALFPEKLPVFSCVPSGDFHNTEEGFLGYEAEQTESPETSFMTVISGSELPLAGIIDGSRVIFRKDIPFSSGDIVACAVDGKTYIRRIKKLNTDLFLLAEGTNADPIRLTTDDFLSNKAVILAVAVKVIINLKNEKKD